MKSFEGVIWKIWCLMNSEMLSEGDENRWGYSLDWDGPVSLESVNSGPAPTGRALTHETSITRIQ